MNLNINPKWIVYLAMGFPVAYVFMGWDFPVIILAALAVGGLFYFNDNFIPRSEMKEYAPLDLGTQETLGISRYHETMRTERYQPNQAGEPPTLRYKRPQQ